MYQALPFVKERKLYSGFFGKFSMSYHSFLVVGQAIACECLMKLKHFFQIMWWNWSMQHCWWKCNSIASWPSSCCRLCWQSTRFCGWSCTCMCSSSAGRSWGNREAPRNEPEETSSVSMLIHSSTWSLFEISLCLFIYEKACTHDSDYNG